MKKLGVVLLSVLIGSQAFADLSGTWVGWGIWSFDGSGVNCNMTLKFTEQPQKLIRHGGYFECNVVGMETYAATWDLINNELFFEDTAVGTYDGKEFSLTEVANETTNIYTKMSINGDTMTYEEKWISNDGTLIYEILGNFKR